MDSPASRSHLPEEPRDRPWWSAQIIASWIVLILVFAAIYRLRGAPNDPGGAAPELSPLTVAAIAFGGFGLFLVGYLAWFKRTAKRFNSENHVALAFVSRSELDQAARRFDLLLTRYRWPRSLHMIARHNFSWTLLRQGALDRAIDGFQTVLHANTNSCLRPTTAGELASALALKGDVDAAERWLEEAEKRAGDAQDQRRVRGILHLARAVIMCRRNRPGDAARGLDADWREIENTLAGEQLGPLRVVRAFALSANDGPRGAGIIDVLIRPLRDAPAGAFDFLGREWPEMRAFLVANGL